jgi:hypothetical protein
MATVYKFEITSHWIAYHPEDMKKMIEKALYSCENEITVNNLEEQANGADLKTEKCTLHGVIVSGFKCKACGSDNIKERSGYKVCFDCGKSH